MFGEREASKGRWGSQSNAEESPFCVKLLSFRKQNSVSWDTILYHKEELCLRLESLVTDLLYLVTCSIFRLVDSEAGGLWTLFRL